MLWGNKAEISGCFFLQFIQEILQTHASLSNIAFCIFPFSPEQTVQGEATPTLLSSGIIIILIVTQDSWLIPENEPSGN